MAKYATGTKSKAISDISGFEVRYTQLRTTWDNLRVEPEEFDPKHPQLTPAKNVTDATALYDPRPDNDPENVIINIGFTQDIFASRIARSQTGSGVSSLGSVGTVLFIIEEEQTGVAGTTAIGAFGAGFDVSGVTGTTDIGDYTPQDQTDVSPSKVTGTTAIGNFQTAGVVTGVQATGATGTESITHDRIFELPNGGSEGTGAIGTSTPETDVISTNIAGTGTIGAEIPQSDVIASGVAGTGVIGTFGEEGNGQLNLTVTPTSATGTANAGTEVAESEIPETNTNGWGEQAWGIGVWGGDEEIRATGGVGSSTIDIFFGPFPSGNAGTTAIGTYVPENELTETGVSGTSAVGTESLETDVNPSGLAGTTAIGAYQASFVVDVTKVTGTTAIGTFNVETEINETGVAGTGGVGTVGINSGFGQGAWNDDTWGN
tara:strand:+ start:782 stop:2077 length:1296 start_codon:yes stop_codon:yes gene_type:complete